MGILGPSLFSKALLYIFFVSITSANDFVTNPNKIKDERYEILIPVESDISERSPIFERGEGLSWASLINSGIKVIWEKGFECKSLSDFGIYSKGFYMSCESDRKSYDFRGVFSTLTFSHSITVGDNVLIIYEDFSDMSEFEVL